MSQERHEVEDHPVETLYDGQWLRMKRRGHWEYAERSHGNGMAVIIIAATPDDRVLFVEQYRVPLGKRTIEMPAGLVGDDHAHDTLESAARRELIEETGWEPGTVFVLDNGQRWRVLKGRAELREPLQSPEILVVSGLAGRYFLQVHEDLPKARVYRID